MKRLRSKMTTEELADSLGVARQTVNRWIRQQGWKTEGINGVKGGRARLIHIDARVREHIMSIPAIRNRQAIYQLAEAPSLYGESTSSGLLPQIIDSLENLTLIEQERLQTLLTREGLQGFLTRLGITELHA
ncbi:YfeC-like transcriptional regulator [Enterobacter soli]|uniref:YfeC-like transcriptional regulator n=1 Tax=Enterobacter soli TaxID=885040 RepID=UPI003EDB40BB